MFSSIVFKFGFIAGLNLDWFERKAVVLFLSENLGILCWFVIGGCIRWFEIDSWD